MSPLDYAEQRLDTALQRARDADTELVLATLCLLQQQAASQMPHVTHIEFEWSDQGDYLLAWEARTAGPHPEESDGCVEWPDNNMIATNFTGATRHIWEPFMTANAHGTGYSLPVNQTTTATTVPKSPHREGSFT